MLTCSAKLDVAPHRAALSLASRERLTSPPRLTPSSSAPSGRGAPALPPPPASCMSPSAHSRLRGCCSAFASVKNTPSIPSFTESPAKPITCAIITCLGHGCGLGPARAVRQCRCLRVLRCAPSSSSTAPCTRLQRTQEPLRSPREECQAIKPTFHVDRPGVREDTNLDRSKSQKKGLASEQNPPVRATSHREATDAESAASA